MDKQKNKVKLFEGQQVRHVWDEEAERWWLSVVDVVAVLTDSDYQKARKYWKVLKGRLLAEGNESVTNCYQLKMLSSNCNPWTNSSLRPSRHCASARG